MKRTPIIFENTQNFSPTHILTLKGEYPQPIELIQKTDDYIVFKDDLQQHHISTNDIESLRLK